MFYWYHYLHHVVSQISISDLMMNAHTSLLITLPTSWCMCDHYGIFNDEYAQISYWKHYLNHGGCQITISDIMMNAHKCPNDNTT
jgi:hypothetical protein